eukprot:scaffold421336_cov57-Attheya_sp.AAC.2
MRCDTGRRNSLTFNRLDQSKKVRKLANYFEWNHENSRETSTIAVEPRNCVKRRSQTRARKSLLIEPFEANCGLPSSQWSKNTDKKFKKRFLLIHQGHTLVAPIEYFIKNHCWTARGGVGWAALTNNAGTVVPIVVHLKGCPTPRRYVRMF